MVDKLCNKCNKEKDIRDFYQKKSGKPISECKSCNIDRITKVRQDIKTTLVKEFGGKCSICGYNRCIQALQFHHKNPSNKSFGIGNGNIKSLSKIKEEAQKCILVCSNCHVEIENNIISLSSGL